MSKSFDRKEYMREYNKKYRIANKDNLRECNIKYKEDNKELLKKKRREYIHKNKKRTKEAARRLKLKQRYGITTTEYYLIYGSQEGKCAICGKEYDLLHIDHCHKTKTVRGLLCGGCNRALGMFKDDINNLKNAIKYLKNFYE